MEGNRILTTFEEKRFSRLLRQAALAHIRREYRRATELVDEVLVLLEWSDRAEWKQGIAFFSQWREAVRDEQAGRPLRAAPAAWMEQSSRIASCRTTSPTFSRYTRKLGRSTSTAPPRPHFSASIFGQHLKYRLTSYPPPARRTQVCLWRRR